MLTRISCVCRYWFRDCALLVCSHALHVCGRVGSEIVLCSYVYTFCLCMPILVKKCTLLSWSHVLHVCAGISLGITLCSYAYTHCMCGDIGSKNGLCSYVYTFCICMPVLVKEFTLPSCSYVLHVCMCRYWFREFTLLVCSHVCLFLVHA